MPVRTSAVGLVGVVVGVMVAGCGADTPRSEAPPTSVASDASAAASDGVVSPSEASRATDLVRSDAIASELFGRYGGRLASWEPAVLEGEPRGATAWIDLVQPVTMSPKAIRAGSFPPPARVEDYVLERVELGDELVSRYTVIVDLPTMTIVHLAPSPAPPVTVAPPTG